jgi:citronellol/citronellal dehydrogenase
MGNSCEGRVALVTGASQGGTGTGLAIRLAAEGARVAITARSEAGLRETQQRIEALGGSAHLLVCDLADPNGGRDQLIPETEAALGPVDILVNNAAIGPYQPFDTFTMEDLERTQQVNVWAPWLLCQQAIGGMRDRGAGWVLNMTTSVAELPPGPPFATSGPSKTGTLYGGSKAMLNRMTVGLASEVEGQNIAVNALTPQAAILTRALEPARASGAIHEDLFEPLDTMVEAALALCTSGPSDLHARIAYSLDLLIELGRPVYDLSGSELAEGWQPADLPGRLQGQRDALEAGSGGGYGLERD